ncbi:MAG: 2-iminoacetate synthase ThiH [Sedimentisphaerales bacterium]|nr:2-iminoacetate synthase ThiH [Sedimentisphaerales bacterium]
MTTATQKIDIQKILADRGLDGCGREIWQKRLGEITPAEVEWALSRKPGYYVLDRLLTLVSPAAENYLEKMAQLTQQLTLQRFGKTVRLYAPLYLSNYCVNGCVYCGFNKNHQFPRTRLTIEQALAEADIIAKEGFRDLLLVSSEDRQFVSVDYLCKLASKLRTKFSSLSVEIYQMTTDEYAKLFAAGIEGVTLYQETYDRDLYDKYHPAGPKADYDYRLSGVDNFAQAEMREIGIGVLLGLSDWRLETLALAEHAHYLMKRYWQSRISFSFPRLRPAKDVDRRQFRLLSDKNLVQMILALRLCFADAGMTISTREPADLRDRLVKLGITRMSAGSKTNPGGYTGKTGSVEQFEIDDKRTPAQIASMLKASGLEPVWKDWDAGFLLPSGST